MAGVIEAAVREAQVVHAAAVLEQEHQESRLRVAIIVPIMTDPADYIPVIQVIKILVPKVPALIFILFFYAIFYIAILGGTRKQNAAYKYFKANPEKLSNAPMTLFSDCPSCGASNAAQNEVCPYCGGLLKISDGNKKFVSS